MRNSALTLLLVVTAGSAWGQTNAPSNSGDALAAICAGVLSEGAGGVSGDKAKLCTCLATETPARLSEADMHAYAAASLANKAPPDGVREKSRLSPRTACSRRSDAVLSRTRVHRAR